MKTQDITITILWGLPGSGKTTFARKDDYKPYYRQSRTDPFIIEFDNFKDNLRDGFVKKLKELCHCYNIYYNIIIDSLVTTNEEAKEIINITKEFWKGYNIIYKIIAWEENRESCLWNDRGRRDKTSEITIKNKAYEKPDYQQLEIDKKNIEYKKVIRKPEYIVYFDTLFKKMTNPIQRDREKINLIKSARWSLGGEYGNCWNDHMSPISAGTALASFDDFDNLINEIDSNCSFIKYKKLYNKSVSIEESSESDYYGGYENFNNYVCDLEKLYDELLELKMIERIEDN